MSVQRGPGLPGPRWRVRALAAAPLARDVCRHPTGLAQDPTYAWCMAEMQVLHNPDRSRYELTIDGAQVGFADYDERGDVLVFPHTVVDPHFEGRGVGSALVKGALDDVRTKGFKVRPTCSFVRGYINRHPEYRDLLA